VSSAAATRTRRYSGEERILACPVGAPRKDDVARWWRVACSVRCSRATPACMKRRVFSPWSVQSLLQTAPATGSHLAWEFRPPMLRAEAGVGSRRVLPARKRCRY